MNARPKPHHPTDTGATAPRLRLHLLGGFRATRDSGPAPAERWPRLTAQALVKLLAVVPGHRVHREQLMESCWPGTDPQSAAVSLRVALHAARRQLEPELAPRTSSSYVITDGAWLFLDPATVWIDVDDAQAAARSALDGGDTALLADALARFTGDLLPEDRYAEWAAERRAQLAELKEKVLLALASAHLAAGELREAADAAQQILVASPAEEVAHRILIDVYTRQDLRRRAVRQYHLCREALDDELGVLPDAETERLHRAALAAVPSLVAPDSSLPAALRVPAGTPLRGRDDVLDRLLAADGPAITLLTGEAGVGKTRLASEAARRAAGSGSAVLWGGGHDAEGHTPYGAFAEALDGWLAERDGTQRARVGAEYPELASFLPALGRVHADVERGPEEERDRLFRATAGLLRQLSASQPVLIVLDDLHATDEGSFQLLSHLARRAAQADVGLRFLVTCREEEIPATDARRAGLNSLLRRGLAVREEVPRLDEEACLAVAGDAARIPSAAADGEQAARLHRVWELSLGNPLFAIELAHSAGSADGTHGTVAPDGVRQLVAQRLGGLDHDARRIVEALSVAGPETALSELLDVAAHELRPPIPGAAAADALERAISASLIEEREILVAGKHMAGLTFRHPLVRLTCYEQLSEIRRRQLHGAFAQTVLARRPAAVDTLAAHFSRADDPRAADYLRAAAARAAALNANDTADRYYGDLVDRLDADAALSRLAHAQVLRRMGNFGRAAAVLRLALAEFVARGDTDHAVLAAARIGEILVYEGAADEGRELLRTHPVTADTAPEPAADHYLTLALIRKVQGRYEDGLTAGRQAQAAGEQVHGAARPGILARSYARQATNLGLAGRFHEAREAADLALAPAQEYGDPSLLGAVLSTLRENERRSGRLREAITNGERALSLAEESGDATAVAFERANLAELWLLLEEFDTARTLAEAAVTGADADEAWCIPYALVTLALVRMRTGGTAEAAELLDRAETVASGSADRQAGHNLRTARAELALRTDRPHDTLRAVAGVPEEAPVLVAWGEILTGRPESAHRIAEAEVARALRTGERIAEADARIALAVAQYRLAEDGATRETAQHTLSEARTLVRELPYPAGTTHAAAALRLMNPNTPA